VNFPHHPWRQASLDLFLCLTRSFLYFMYVGTPVYQNMSSWLVSRLFGTSVRCGHALNPSGPDINTCVGSDSNALFSLS
jgi:hypothetical protein